MESKLFELSEEEIARVKRLPPEELDSHMPEPSDSELKEVIAWVETRRKMILERNGKKEI